MESCMLALLEREPCRTQGENPREPLTNTLHFTCPYFCLLQTYQMWRCAVLCNSKAINALVPGFPSLFCLIKHARYNICLFIFIYLCLLLLLLLLLLLFVIRLVLLVALDWINLIFYKTEQR